jgi:hypothetical protein
MAPRLIGVGFTPVLESGSAVNALCATTCTLRLLVTFTFEMVMTIRWAMPRITRRPAGRFDPTHGTS